MMTLYELTEQWRNFDFDIDEETGEITNGAELDQLEMERDEKLKNCVYYYKNMMAEAEALKAEKEKLAKRQQTAKKKAESMKEYIAYCLDGEKFAPKDDATVRVTYRKSESVECADIYQVPDDYLRYKEPELDKTKIKKALKAGEAVEGCTLVEKQNIQIR